MIDYDTWLLRGSGIDDPMGGSVPDEFDFTMKLRGGTIKVHCTTEWDTYSEEGGTRCDLCINLKLIHWSFDEEAELTLTKEEEREIMSIAKEELEEYK